MLEPGFTEEQKRRVESAKRGVWSQPGAGREYQFFAYKASPLLRLKNLIEISFVMRHVTGPRVLDAGAGTGRFTWPLRQRGLHAVALDISREMLAEAKKHEQKAGEQLPCAMGLIERLPFPDQVFDSVVSITVLRHFPDWLQTLDEYMRVLRPGGRVIFDMASGEQRNYLVTRGLLPNVAGVDGGFDPLAFEATLTMKDLRSLAMKRGWTIITAGPHEFFHANPLLDHVLAGSKDEFEKRLFEFMDSSEVLGLCELMTRRWLMRLSPCVSASWMIALEKRPDAGDGYAPGYEGIGDVTGDSPRERLLNLLRASGCALSDELNGEVAALISHPTAKCFLNFLEKELLPQFPLDAAFFAEHQ